MAGQVAHEIGSLPQPSAARYARKALETLNGRSSGFAVVEMHDSVSNNPAAATAHLVFRVYHPGSQGEFTPEKPVTACYEVGFNFHGLVGEPARQKCPAGATPLNPPPIPVWEVPESYNEPLRSVLTGLPATVTKDDVLAALSRSMPAPPVDPETHVQGRAPELDVAIRGADVGVAYRAGDRSSPGGVECLLAARLQGVTSVWSPPWRQVQPGELSCTAQTALDRQGI